MNTNEYDYIISKPDIEEVLYHGAFHKYLNKYMGKNGKWVYVYNKAKGMANQAAGAASGMVNKAKAALPGLQKQAMSTAVSTRNKVGAAVSSGSKQASALKAQARKKVSAMLPILTKKINKAKNQATGVKLLARDKTKGVRKQARSSYNTAKKAVTKKAKGAYYRGKSKVQEQATKARQKKNKTQYVITDQGGRAVSNATLSKENLYGYKGYSTSRNASTGRNVNTTKVAAKGAQFKKNKKRR